MLPLGCVCQSYSKLVIACATLVQHIGYQHCSDADPKYSVSILMCGVHTHAIAITCWIRIGPSASKPHGFLCLCIATCLKVSNLLLHLGIEDITTLPAFTLQRECKHRTGFMAQACSQVIDQEEYQLVEIIPLSVPAPTFIIIMTCLACDVISQAFLFFS